jgi:hypothetical protein
MLPAADAAEQTSPQPAQFSPHEPESPQFGLPRTGPPQLAATQPESPQFGLPSAEAPTFGSPMGGSRQAEATHVGQGGPTAAGPGQPIWGPLAPKKRRVGTPLIVIGCVVVLIAAVFGVVLANRPHNKSAPTALSPGATPSTNQVVIGGNATVGDSAPGEPSTVDQTTAPTTTQADTQRLTGPDGMQVSVPAGWSAQAGATPANTQVNNPASPDQFVRFGAAPPDTGGSLLTGIQYSEQHTSSIQDGYQRLELSDVPFGDTDEAVDWEFTFVKDGVTRHAGGLYWLVDGVEYVVYASSDASNWDSTAQILREMEDTASPS